MCYICWVNSGYTLPGGPVVRPLTPADAPRTIPPSQLIDPVLQAFNANTITDGALDIYLNTTTGAVSVGGGPFGAQTIQAVGVDAAFSSFLQTAMNQLKGELGLDIRFTTQLATADLRFYFDSQFSLDDPSSDGVTVGLAVTNPNSTKNYWEVFLNHTALSSDTNLRNYVALHEIGHVLGLEHPFDNTDGDVFASTEPLLSAWPEETVMSYRQPYSGSYPTYFTDNDLAALKQLWPAVPTSGGGGSRTTTGTVDWPLPLDPTLPWPPVPSPPRQLNADPSGDVLIGGFGNDQLIGGPAADDLIGMNGADQMQGGAGANRYSSITDGAQDWIIIDPDAVGPRRQKGKRYDGRTVDIITEMGREDRVRLTGVPGRLLQFQPVVLSNSPYGEMRGIGIFAYGRLEAVYAGLSLSQEQLKLRTVGDLSATTV